MGTWNTGPFDNDSAHDAVNALVNGTFCMAQFRFECGLGSLDTDEAESVIALAAVESFIQLCNRRWLVAGGFELGDDLEGFFAPLNLPHWAELGLREDGMFSSKSHAGKSIAKCVGRGIARR